MTLQPTHLNFLTHEENYVFLFISVPIHYLPLSASVPMKLSSCLHPPLLLLSSPINSSTFVCMILTLSSTYAYLPSLFILPSLPPSLLLLFLLSSSSVPFSFLNLLLLPLFPSFPLPFPPHSSAPLHFLSIFHLPPHSFSSSRFNPYVYYVQNPGWSLTFKGRRATDPGKNLQQ